ncbi:MAG TPA: iron-containing redox enzyme family protein [Nitrospira sp.]|nr:iron-containing redox enzyme family protein [Nitrospira sp.]
MINPEKILDLIRDEIKTAILYHSLIKRLFDQDKSPLTKSNYVGLLVQIFHLIRHTPHYLTYASSHSIDDSWMRNWWMDFAVDERGHELLCLADLRRMNLSEDLALKSLPGVGARAMVANNFYIGSRTPSDLIGFALVTEKLGVTIAQELSIDIEARYEFTKGATSFIKVHGAEDTEHYDGVIKALNRFVGDEERLNGILHTARYTLHNYSQLFSDALSHPEVEGVLS